MDHPNNFGGDCPWFTRDYGHLSPSPFNFLDQPWRMEPGETLTLTGEDILIETESAEGYACGEDGGYLTALDTTLDDELVDEGIAREIVRSVQDARKQAGLEVSDRIVLGVSGSGGVERALAAHRNYIMSETLATTWETGQSSSLYAGQRELGGESWTLEFSKA